MAIELFIYLRLRGNRSPGYFIGKVDALYLLQSGLFIYIFTLTGDIARSDSLLGTLNRDHIPASQEVRLRQIQARNMFSKRDWVAGLEILLDGLRDLGVFLKTEYTEDESRRRHMECREMIIGFGVENIRNIPVATDQECHLCNTLLSE